MQTINDGTHDILPVAAPFTQRPDRARMSVTMLRQSDGKLRRDGSSAANGQPKHPVDERGGVQGASELQVRERQRAVAKNVVYLRSQKEKRRWRKQQQKHDRLGGQDKGARCAPQDSRAFSTAYMLKPRGARTRRSLRLRHFLNELRVLARCAGPRP